jgi:membrane-associated protease RseP (regulator of RpoE activity)
MLSNELIKSYIETLKDLVEIDVIYGSKDDVLLRGNLISPFRPSKIDILNKIAYLPGKAEVLVTEPKVVVRVRPPGEAIARKIPWLNIVLFLLTLALTLIAGAVYAGVDFISKPQIFWQDPLSLIIAGMPFSFSLLGILLFHEFGHYTASRLHGVKVTYPYFIPFPNPLGTMGAFIRLKSPFINRKQLLDVGAAGPLAGMIVAIPLAIWGFAHPTFVPEHSNMLGLFSRGDSLLLNGIISLVQPSAPEGFIAVMNPVAFAGWVGFFVTMLNLLPIGQLDGGHIVYAMFGKYQTKITYVVMFVMAILSFWWIGWLVWIFLGLVLVKVKHPPTMLDEIPLDKKRLAIGYFCLLLFILCFIPIPFLEL